MSDQTSYNRATVNLYDLAKAWQRVTLQTQQAADAFRKLAALRRAVPKP